MRRLCEGRHGFAPAGRPAGKIDIKLDTREAAVTSIADTARLEQALRDGGWRAERIPA